MIRGGPEPAARRGPERQPMDGLGRCLFCKGSQAPCGGGAQGPQVGQGHDDLGGSTRVQFYSGNFLDGSIKGKGTTYGQHAGLCLETQKFPNAINVPAWRDQFILGPGQNYRHVMVHAFSTEP